MTVGNYRELLVWQKAMEVVKVVYSLVSRLPMEERFALSDQMRRSAVSIPSNIAEGQARNSTSEFVRFLSIAQGSRAELETQLLLCVELGFLSEADIKVAMGLLEEITKMTNSLQKTLNNPQRPLTTNH